MAASGFLTKLAENNCEGNHFSVEFFSLTGFLQFLSFFKHVKGVSRTQSNIKMEPIAKIANGSRGVFRAKWDIQNGAFCVNSGRLKIDFSKSFILDVRPRSEYASGTVNCCRQKLNLKSLIGL